MKEERMKRLLTLMFVFLILGGCTTSYVPSRQILPAYIKNIAIRPFVNKTTQIGIEDQLYLKVYDEFVSDGRFTITKEENADGVLVGEITHYILQPFGWGSTGETTQYKLRVLLNIYFVDKVNNVTLWEEPNFEGVQIYYAKTVSGADNTMSDSMTEEDARNAVWDMLSKKIFRRVFEGFGTTGISGKKVPN
jgi:hypothetical protein